MLCALIMAGGIGSRFWPQSTEKKPKQFLNLVGEKTMIQMTYDRISKLVDKNKIFIVTNKKYVDLVREQINNIDDENIIIEPSSKNTAPCILLSSLYIKNIYPDANIVVLPSDHIIANENKFIDTLKLANDYLNNTNSESIVTIGVTPNRPETGYGYIKCLNKTNLDNVVKVEKFVEKPDFDTAKQYLNDGNYLWNAGMFIFNVNYMLKELNKNLPSEYELLSSLPNISDDSYNKRLDEKYSKCTNISIDYAVMEKSDNIYTIPSDFGWDDVGTWQSLERYCDKDLNENIGRGSEIDFVNSTNCVVYGLNKKIILLNVDNLFVTEGEDVIIITKKESIDSVKNLNKK